MVAEPQSTGLIRALGLWDVTAITAGTILGSAIFVAAAFVPRAVPHPTLALLLWAAGGLQGAALFTGDKTAAAWPPSYVAQLKTAIREFIATSHATPKPFTWTKTADVILVGSTGVLRTIPQNGLPPV